MTYRERYAAIGDLAALEDAVMDDGLLARWARPGDLDEIRREYERRKGEIEEAGHGGADDADGDNRGSD